MATWFIRRMTVLMIASRAARPAEFPVQASIRYATNSSEKPIKTTKALGVAAHRALYLAANGRLRTVPFGPIDCDRLCVL
jgi:hypothetical protein